MNWLSEKLTILHNIPASQSKKRDSEAFLIFLFHGEALSWFGVVLDILNKPIYFLRYFVTCVSTMLHDAINDNKMFHITLLYGYVTYAWEFYTAIVVKSITVKISTHKKTRQEYRHTAYITFKICKTWAHVHMCKRAKLMALLL